MDVFSGDRASGTTPAQELTMTTRAAEISLPVDVEPVTAPPVVGNPALLGLPTAIAGATGVLILNGGWFQVGVTSATVSILIGCSSIGLLIATAWAASLAQNVSASMFGAFAGFFGSYSVLVLGLGHQWFGPAADGGKSAAEVWLVCWLITFVMMTLAMLRLPFAFGFMLVAVDVALLLLLVGTATGTTAYTRAGAVGIFVFLATAVYIYCGATIAETGGRGLPLGRPIVR
jgi:uncharacterized protein